MYILEGNIGAGKSTLLKLLQKEMNHFIEVGYEPLVDWQKQVYGQSLLTNFYQDPSRWSYAMETYAMLSRVREHIKDQAFPNIRRIIERSIYSGHYCFARNGFSNGFMLPLEWEMYNAWFNFLIPGRCKPPHGFIYLRTTPSVAFKRIKKRARDGESLIPLQYIEQLHECHEAFLVNKSDFILEELKSVPVLVLDGDIDFETDDLLYQKIRTEIINFLDMTSYQKVTHGKCINVG